jgi:outer membrane protein assembly factor BamB
MRLIKIAVILSALVAVIGGGFFLLQRRHAPDKPQPAREAAPEVKELPAPQIAPWNTYHGNAQLTGYSSVSLPDTPSVRWRYKAGAPVRQTPVVDNGRVYFATARGEIVALDFNGQRMWSHELFTEERQKDGQPVRARIEAPVAIFERRVFVGTARGVIYSLDADSGNQLWSCKIDSPVLGTINYLPAESAKPARAYVISRADATLTCMDATSGAVQWKGDSINRCDGSPAVSSEAVAFGSCAAALHIFSPDTGKMMRNVAIDDDSQIAGGVAIDGDSIYAGCRSGKIVRIEAASGKILWTNSDSDSEVFSTPAVAGDWVVASSNTSIVYALDRATGKTRWKNDTGAALSSPVIAGDKVLVCGDGQLLLFRLADGAKVGALKISDEITSPAVAGTMVFVGSEDGTVVALGPAIEQERSARQ